MKDRRVQLQCEKRSCQGGKRCFQPLSKQASHHAITRHAVDGSELALPPYAEKNFEPSPVLRLGLVVPRAVTKLDVALSLTLSSISPLAGGPERHSAVGWPEAACGHCARGCQEPAHPAAGRGNLRIGRTGMSWRNALGM